jgi:amidase
MIDSHPLVPTAAPVRLALERLADRLARSGVKVERSHRLLPDLADATRLYMRLLLSFSAARGRRRCDELKASRRARPMTAASGQRARHLANHRDWVLADGAPAQHQWRALFGG